MRYGRIVGEGDTLDKSKCTLIKNASSTVPKRRGSTAHPPKRWLGQFNSLIYLAGSSGVAVLAGVVRSQVLPINNACFYVVCVSVNVIVASVEDRAFLAYYQ